MIVVSLMRTLKLTLGLAVLAFILGRHQALLAQDPPPEDGIFITVPNPIKEESVEQIKVKIDRVRNQPNRSIKKIVFDFNPQGKESNSTNYGVCYNLASYIRSLGLNQGIKTIGFVQAKTTGHTVLAALACTELVMTSDASLGQVVPGGTLPEKSEMDFYAKLAGSRAVFVQKMFDPNVQIMSGLLNQNTIYFDGRQVKEAPFVTAKNPQPVREFAVGRVELYPGKVARHYELANKVLDVNPGTDKRDLVRLEYGLDKSALAELSLGERACKIDISGTIDTIQHEKVTRQINEAKSRKEDTIFFVLDCAGGDPQAAFEMARDILELKDADERPITTVAWIPDRASDLGLFLAIACNDIVMFRGPNVENDAVLGDFENFLKSKTQNPDFLKKQFKELLELRKQNGRSPIDPLLLDAMLDRDLVVVRGQNLKSGETKLFKQAELEQDKDWRFDGAIKPKGKLLELRATTAKELRLTRETVDKKDVRAVYSLFQLEPKQVRDAEPHWLDSFAAFLRRKEVSIILILMGIAGLILEMKAPGLMLPGIVAALCFVLFFWSQSVMNQQIIYLAILLFILGMVLIAIEIFILPGFGITGLSGIILVIAGLGLATVDKIPSTTEEWGTLAGRVMQYGFTMVASTVVAVIFARYLPKIPYANRLMLVPPSDTTESGEPMFLPGAEQAASLLGKTGVSTSVLRPSGAAKFGDVMVDVVSEGDFIESGSLIQVVEVEGTRIVVKKM